jgi:hypothetical protein
MVSIARLLIPYFPPIKKKFFNCPRALKQQKSF